MAGVAGPSEPPLNLRRRFVYNRVGGKLDSGSKLTCGGQEKMNEQDSRVEVVRECLTEGGDANLDAFFC